MLWRCLIVESCLGICKQHSSSTIVPGLQCNRKHVIAHRHALKTGGSSNRSFIHFIIANNKGFIPAMVGFLVVVWNPLKKCMDKEIHV